MNYPTQKFPRNALAIPTIEGFACHQILKSEEKNHLLSREAATMKRSHRCPTSSKSKRSPYLAHRSSPSLTQMASVELNFAFFSSCARPWEVAYLRDFHFLTSNASPVWLHANHGKTPPHPRFLITDTQLKSNHVFPKLRHSLLPFRKSLSRAQLRNGLSALAPHHPAFPNRSLPSMAVSF